MNLPSLTLLYWPADEEPGGFHGQLAGTRLQLRTSSLDELSQRAVELHAGLFDGFELVGVALVPIGQPPPGERAGAGAAPPRSAR